MLRGVNDSIAPVSLASEQAESRRAWFRSAWLRRGSILGAATLLVCVGGEFGRRSVLAFEYEYESFHPRPEVVPLPADRRHLEALHTLQLSPPERAPVAAWYLPPRNGDVIIYVHGSPGTRAGFTELMRGLGARGFGALVLDVPGHGESSGDARWDAAARQAVSSAIDFVAALPDVAPGHIGILGYSMGSCIAAQVAAEDERVRGVVLSAAFTKLAPQLLYELRTRWPLIPYLGWAAAWLSGVSLTELQTDEAVSRLGQRPLLLIAGDHDGVVPLEMAQQLYELAKGPKELWVIPGAGHLDQHATAGAAYVTRIGNFFAGALGT